MVIGYMSLNLSSYQNNIFEKFKSSLGGNLTDLKTNLSGIDWVERSVSAARYTAELANKDAWLAMCDAFNAVSNVLAALYQAEQAQLSAYNAANESANAACKAWEAENEAMAAENQAAREEYNELKEANIISINEGKEAMFDTVVKSTQNSNEILEFIIANNKLNSQKSSIIEIEEQEHRSNILKNNDKNSNAKHQRSSINEETEHSRSRKEEAKRKKESSTSRKESQTAVKVDTTKEKEHANVKALNAESITLNARKIISSAEAEKNNADIRTESAFTTSYDANSETSTSTMKLNDYNYNVKNIDNITNYLNNLISIIQKTDSSKTNFSSDTTNKLEQISNIKSNLSNIKEAENNNNKSKDPKIDSVIQQTQDTIQTITSEILQHEDVPVILSKNLSEYKDLLGNQMNYNKIKVDTRETDRRSTGDRRNQQEEIFDFNKRDTSDGRRNSNRRENDLTKALFIDNEELIRLLT
ncbi:MAG: hypothetical protein AB7V50_10920 [Vampirovibrionia bacterium]